ncbi:MAG: hypothetical protein HQM15_10055 [Deltaproteobacteria bacterium]|nr:hypothetical protein [Deltaproteobacteria bacterium]
MTESDRYKVEEHEIKNILKNYFQKNETISRQQMEALLGLGSTSVKYLIRDLIQEKFLAVVGKGPATRYKIRS